MKSLKTIIRWAIYIAVVGGIGIGLYFALKPKPVDVDVTAIELGDMLVTVNEDGRTRIKERYVVSAPLAGRLVRIEMDAGDPVSPTGRPIVVIQPRDPELLNTRELKQAEALMNARQVAAEKAVPLVDAAQAALDFASIEAERMTRINEQGAGAQGEYDRAHMTLRIRQEEYRAAVHAERIAKYEFELAKAALVRTRTDDDFSNFEINSPIAGKILRVLQESSTVVTSGSPLIEVGDPADLEVVIDVLSSDGVKIKKGADVILERWGGEKSLSGKVRLVEPSAFTKISSLGVEEQRVNVIVDLDDPPESRQSLGDGFRVEAKIVIWSGNGMIKIPSGALFRHGKEWATFVVENNIAKLRILKLGQHNDVEAEIVNGIELGETVILHPSDKIENDTRIKPR